MKIKTWGTCMSSVRMCVAAAAIIAFLGTFAVSDRALAQDNADVPAECRDRDSLLKAIQDARSQLRSGVYEATGKLRREYKTDKPLKGEVRVFSAFDYDRDRIRFDRFEPFAVKSLLGERQEYTVGFKLIRAPGRTVVWDREILPVNLERPSGRIEIHPAEFEVPAFGRPFDVRTFGIMGRSSHDSGATLDRAIEVMSTYELISTVAVKPGVCRVTFRLGPQDELENTLWIDYSHGYTVTRAELRFFDRSDKDLPDYADVLSLTEVEWKQWRDVWIPTSYSNVTRFGSEDRYEVDLEWRSVNHEIPIGLFEIESLDLPPRMRVVDRRAGS